METKPNLLLPGNELLTAVFGETKPSLRWLENLKKRRLVPYLKLGRLVRYDPDAVRAALEKNCLVNAKGAK